MWRWNLTFSALESHTSTTCTPHKTSAPETCFWQIPRKHQTSDQSHAHDPELCGRMLSQATRLPPSRNSSYSCHLLDNSKIYLPHHLVFGHLAERGRDRIMRGLPRNDLEALLSEVENRCDDNRTAILIEGCLKKWGLLWTWAEDPAVDIRRVATQCSERDQRRCQGIRE